MLSSEVIPVIEEKAIEEDQPFQQPKKSLSSSFKEDDEQKNQIEQLKAKKDKGKIQNILMGFKGKSVKMDDVKKLDKDKILSG